MNIEHEIRWGVRTPSLLNSARAGTLTDKQQTDFSRPVLEEKFGWLDDYADAWNRWEELSGVSQTACRTVRVSGYDSSLPDRIESALAVGRDEATVRHSIHNEAVTSLTNGLLEFCEETATGLRSTNRLPGSSEVIESLIGKGKRMASNAGAGSMTGQILTLAASVVDPPREFLAAALQTCGIETRHHWCRTFLPTSSQSLCHRDLTPTKTEQNLRKPKLITTPTLPLPSLTPTTALSSGDFRVWVKAIGPGGEFNDGTWSKPVDFTIAAVSSDSPEAFTPLLTNLPQGNHTRTARGCRRRHRQT